MANGRISEVRIHPRAMRLSNLDLGDLLSHTEKMVDAFTEPDGGMGELEDRVASVRVDLEKSMRECMQDLTNRQSDRVLHRA